MNPEVVVVGGYVQDLTWRCVTFPRPGETVVGSFMAGPGGKGSNRAIAAGRAGDRTVLIGAVGSDAFAGEAQRFHRVKAVDTTAAGDAFAGDFAAGWVNARGGCPRSRPIRQRRRGAAGDDRGHRAIDTMA